jgi:hypothetical protein
MNQGLVVRIPDYIEDYARREAAAEGRKPGDVIGQLWRLGLEAREARKGSKRRTCASLPRSRR